MGKLPSNHPFKWLFHYKQTFFWGYFHLWKHHRPRTPGAFSWCPTCSQSFKALPTITTPLAEWSFPSFSLIPPTDLFAVRLQIRRSPKAWRNSGTASASSVAKKIKGLAPAWDQWQTGMIFLAVNCYPSQVWLLDSNWQVALENRPCRRIDLYLQIKNCDFTCASSYVGLLDGYPISNGPLHQFRISACLTNPRLGEAILAYQMSKTTMIN